MWRGRVGGWCAPQGLRTCAQELYLDKVELSRVLPHPPLAPQPPAAPLPDPFLPLHNGINLDVALPDAGVWFKTQYEAAQMQVPTPPATQRLALGSPP